MNSLSNCPAAESCSEMAAYKQLAIPGTTAWKEVRATSSLTVREQVTAKARVSQSPGTGSELTADIHLLLGDK